MLLVAAAVAVATRLLRTSSDNENGPAVAAHVADPKLELAKATYKEVLDATTHQDDKIGRFLTAVAFFTAAAVAFGTRADVLHVTYNIDGGIPLPAILFAVFFALIVVTVVFLLMGLGQTLRPPQKRGTNFTSRLFFMSLADFPRQKWEDYWRKPVAEIEAALLTDYVRESHNLAVRADKKYRRTSEAQVFFTMALLCFALALALAINDLARPGGHDISWGATPRLVVTGVVASFTLALGYGWVRYEEALNVTRWERIQRFTPFVPWASTLYVAAMLLPPRFFPLGLGAYIASGAFVLVALGVFDRRDLRSAPGITAVVLWIAAFWATPLAIVTETDRVRLVLAGLVVVWLELPRLLSATRVWAERVPLADSAETGTS